MSILRTRLVPVLLAATVLVGGANLASYAANGKPLLLGKTNVATKTTTLKNTGKGPALSLKGKANAPSLAVSSKVKVKKLNADAVDGLDGTSLRTKVWSYTIPATGPVASLNRSFPGLPAGRYLASYAVYAAASAADVNILCLLVNPQGDAAANLVNVGTSYLTLGFGQGISATGLVDTRTAKYTLSCAADGGGTFQVINPTDVRSQVTFERVDDAVTTTAASAPERPSTTH